jgi:antitoxin component YwqK of YwqJK toxin-antitoxin module
LTDNYPDGAVRVVREVVKLSDDQLVNHGKFTEYYANGQKFAEGSYDHGVHDGQWTFWHEKTSQICKVVNFKQGRADGSWDVFREDGTLQAKRTYKDNLRDGVWLIYHEDGKTPRIEETYKDGLRNGVSRAYFPDGKVQREMTFKNNELDGLMTEWDQAGRKTGEVNLKNGKRDGKFILYRPDGTKTEYMYKDGRLLTGGSAS